MYVAIFKIKMINTNLRYLISLLGVLGYIIDKTLNMKTPWRIFLYFTTYYGILWWIYTLFSAKLNWIVTWFVVCRCIAIWNIGNILEVLVINCNTSLRSMFERRKYEKTWRFENLCLGIINNSLSRNTVLKCKIYVVFI